MTEEDHESTIYMGNENTSYVESSPDERTLKAEIKANLEKLLVKQGKIGS